MSVCHNSQQPFNGVCFFCLCSACLPHLGHSLILLTLTLCFPCTYSLTRCTYSIPYLLHLYSSLPSITNAGKTLCSLSSPSSPSLPPVSHQENFLNGISMSIPGVYGSTSALNIFRVFCCNCYRLFFILHSARPGWIRDSVDDYFGLSKESSPSIVNFM